MFIVLRPLYFLFIKYYFLLIYHFFSFLFLKFLFCINFVFVRHFNNFTWLNVMEDEGDCF